MSKGKVLTFVKSTPGNLNFASSSLSHGDFLTKISATDQDSKMNSEITYNISNKDAFNTDPTTGIISVKSFLTKSDNRLTITVEDNGAPSSATEKNITYFWKNAFQPVSDRCLFHSVHFQEMEVFNSEREARKAKLHF